jgi:hypothetical protein
MVMLSLFIYALDSLLTISTALVLSLATTPTFNFQTKGFPYLSAADAANPPASYDLQFTSSNPSIVKSMSPVLGCHDAAAPGNCTVS